MEKEELSAAQKYFDCFDCLTLIPKYSFVIPRYSLYPFVYDQYRELQNLNCKVINDYHQHSFVADLGNYVPVLGELTPETWDSLYSLPDQGPFILKGETNSKKDYFSTMMFADNKQRAIEIESLLQKDGLIGSQKIYIRKYIPLKKYFDGIGGVPISNEFRFFICNGKVLSGAFYWQNYVDEIEPKPTVDMVPKDFLQKVINKVGNNCNFYVIDVAETESGEWVVIELNSGCQSGLSLNDPETLYNNLYESIS